LTDRRESVESQLESVEDYYVVDNDLKNMKSPFDAGEAIKYLQKYGMSKANCIRMRQRWGFPVKPSDIDDETMIDLL
jgi:hypothetical protein